MLFQVNFSPLTFMSLFLLALSEESCTPNRFYCGSEVAGVMPYWMNKTLWKCRPSGISFDRSFDCKWGCKNIQHDNSYCLCLENSHYCGHQLIDIGWQGYENHSIYKCDDKGSNASLIENCPHQCQVDTYQDSAEDGDQDRVIGWCSGHCQGGTNYCGYKLKEEFGWDGYENDTLYHCHGGNKTTVWTKCPPGTCHSNRCKCNPGQYYCSHELDDQLGWKSLKSRRMELHKCEPNGTSTKGIASCNYCNNTPTALSGDQRPTCECKTGLSYCGRKVQEMGYDGYDNDTLYECRGGNEMTVLSKCPPGMCHSHHCKCNPGQYYCGSQVPHKTSRFPNTTLWQCWPDGIMLTRSFFADCRWGCKSIQDNNSYCFCKENSHYCGHQLHDLGWQGYKDHSLYKCDGGLNASLIENCQHRCEYNRDVEDENVDFGRCSNHCQAGSNYCGYRLKKEFGWDGYENDTLYRCRGRNETTIWSKCSTGTCQLDHCNCNPDQYYCGHELYDQLGWKSFKSRRMELQKCVQVDDGTTTVWITALCNQCNSTLNALSGNRRPICECITNNTYCGYRLQEMGWDEYETNTLYICDEGQTSRKLAACGYGNCDGRYCKCTPDKLYAGHQLYQMGWKDFKSRQMELHKCAPDGTTIGIAICNQCNNTSTALSVSGDQPPTCECKTDLKYCGYTFQEMGWDGFDNSTLYVCEKGQNISKLMACGDGKCRDNSYCECTRQKLYCGHELYQMGWSLLGSAENKARLGRCTDGSDVEWIASCNYCNNTSTTLSVSDDQLPTCECKTGSTYCGNTLQTMGYDGYDNSTLYVCDKGQNITKLMVCGDGKCLGNHCECTRDKLYCGHELYPLGLLGSSENQARLGRCTDGSNLEWISFCNQCNSTPTAPSGHQRPTCECIMGDTYCGYTLYAMGYDGYDNSTLYICEKGQNISKLMACGDGNCRDDSYCECTRDKLYCGHELYQMGWKDFKSRQMELRKCKIYPPWMGSRWTTWIAFCNRCNSTQTALNDDQRPTCECKTNDTYCGYTLQEMGWDGYDEYTLYVCEDGQNIRKLKACGYEQCDKSDNNSYKCDD